MRSALLALFAGLCAQVSASAVELKDCTFTTNGRDELALSIPAQSAAYTLALPTGSIFQTAAGVRVITLRAAKFELPAGAGAAHITVPSAALASTTPPASPSPAEWTPAQESRLESLLRFLATRDDIPRATSQCAVLAVLEDVNFAQWQAWLHARDEEAVSRAIEALVMLRTIAPTQSFRLQSDPDLRLRALRQPGLRGAAQQVYGLALPGDPAAAEGKVPDLGQLLHSKPGDNCPVCRMRQQMQKPGNDL